MTLPNLKIETEIDDKRNWTIWRNWEIAKHKGNIVSQFVTDGILSDPAHRDYFLELWNDYEEDSKKFLTSIIELFHDELGHNMLIDGGTIDFDINFKTRNYKLKLIDEDFKGFREFAIKNLNLELVQRMVREVLKEQE